MKHFVFTATLGILVLTTNLHADYMLSGPQTGLSGSANFSISNNILIVAVTSAAPTAAQSASQAPGGAYYGRREGRPGFTFERNVYPMTSVTGSKDKTPPSSANTGDRRGFDNVTGSTAFAMPYGFGSAAPANCGAPCGTPVTGSAKLTGNTVSRGVALKSGSVSGSSGYDNFVIFVLRLPAYVSFSTSEISGAMLQSRPPE